jgi:hypothetical protein
MPSGSPRHDPGAEDLRRDLKDAQERLRATGEVLQALGRSGSDLEDVLGTVVRSAQSLCRRDAAQLHLFEGGSYRLAWHSGLSDEFRAFVAEHPRFAADHGCASEISRDALVIGRRLAREGVLGRFALDFVRDGAGAWTSYAIEINLRKGGTTHPFLTLQFLTDGRYGPGTACS